MAIMENSDFSFSGEETYPPEFAQTFSSQGAAVGQSTETNLSAWDQSLLNGLAWTANAGAGEAFYDFTASLPVEGLRALESSGYEPGRVMDQATGTSLTDEAKKGESLSGKASKFWEWMNKDQNKTGVNIAANFIAGMATSGYKRGLVKAEQRKADAAMMNANSDAAMLAIKQKQMENASSIKNTNFGTVAPKGGLMFNDLLSTRRARSGA